MKFTILKFSPLVMCFFLCMSCNFKDTATRKNYLYANYNLSFVGNYDDDLMDKKTSLATAGYDNLISFFDKDNSWLKFLNEDEETWYYNLDLFVNDSYSYNLKKQKYSLSLKDMYFGDIIFEKNDFFSENSVGTVYPNYWVRFRNAMSINGENKDLVFEFWIKGKAN